MLSWYDKHGRSFPWRETTNPYKILIAEFLLQKTHVRKVEEVYLEILSKYPDLSYMADAGVNDLAKIIQPLGFINRAERLIALAKKVQVEHGGKIPQDLDTLLSFKGVGLYIATAILVFAFGEKRVVVDTNVLKMLRDEFGIESQLSRPRTDKRVWQLAQELVPKKRVKEFNWALLDYPSQVGRT